MFHNIQYNYKKVKNIRVSFINKWKMALVVRLLWYKVSKTLWDAPLWENNGRQCGNSDSASHRDIHYRTTALLIVFLQQHGPFCVLSYLLPFVS